MALGNSPASADKKYENGSRKHKPSRMMHLRSITVALTIAAVSFSAAAMAQGKGQTATPSNAPAAKPRAAADEATELAKGWALLAQGNAAEAARVAGQLLTKHPRRATVVDLAIEAAIAQGGSAAGLTQYERALGQSKMEEPLPLRRVARAVLHDESRQQQDAMARAEALKALAAEGERPSGPSSAKGGGADTRAEAAAGDERAVQALIKELSVRPDVRTIHALGESGSELAVEPLTRLLKDPRAEVRRAAADALARVGGPDVAKTLVPLLSDSNLSVRLRVAGALARLGDYSGLPLLQKLLADPSPETRLSAAEAMAETPDATWTATVHELAKDPNPEIRVRAAWILAPHEPELAQKVLESLSANENPAIRALAAQALGDVATSDLTALRRLLKNSSRLTRVRAAARILQVTR